MKSAMCLPAVAGLCAIVFSVPSFSQTYATGTFKTNAPATITCKTVSLAGGSLDTTFTFTTTTAGGDSVHFSLPVNLIQNGIIDRNGRVVAAEALVSGNRLALNLPTEFAGSTASLLNLSGRTIASGLLSKTGAASFDLPFANGVCILHVTGKRELSSRIILNGQKSQISFGELLGSAKSGIALVAAVPETAQYDVTVTSNDAGYNSLAVQTMKFAAGANGIIAFTLPVNAIPASQKFAALFPQSVFESMFPMRYGMGQSDSTYIAPSTATNGMAGYDFYGYDQWLKAIDTLSQYTVDVFYHTGDPTSVKVIRTRKSDNSKQTFYGFSGYDQGGGSEVQLGGTVDFATFCNVGTDDVRKLELCAFFSNASHETTGGWVGAQISTFAWGLYYISENDGNAGTYVVDQANNNYPSVSGQSYCGRGPLQISYNYNYGPCSEILYGTKTTLLNNPDLLAQKGNGYIAIMTALWYWMIPQPPKPSCHDVMCGVWTPSAEDITNKRNTSKFGMTINIINGGVECGYGTNASAQDRIDYYQQWFTPKFGVTPEADCGCSAMLPY